MELTLLIFAAVIVAAASIVGARMWMWRPVVKHRVLVQTDADVSFDGVVMSRRGPLLVLADVTVRTEASARVDGLVVIERSRIVFIQRAA